MGVNMGVARDGEGSCRRGIVVRWLVGGGGDHQHGCVRVLNVQSLQLVLYLVWLQVLEGLYLGSEVDRSRLVL